MSEQLQPKSNSSKSYPGKGIQKLDATTFFKVTNFELFVKPNKLVMAAGLVAITCCIGYIHYMRVSVQKDDTIEQNSNAEKQYVNVKKSRWSKKNPHSCHSKEERAFLGTWCTLS